MALLFADEDFSHDVVHELIKLGHHVVTIQDLGLDNIGYPDEKVLELATSMRRATLTLNRKHYRKLHKQTLHSGIIICTHDANFFSIG